MGVSYREYLKIQAKRARRPKGEERAPRTEAEERAAFRQEYFRKPSTGYNRVHKRKAHKAILNG